MGNTLSTDEIQQLKPHLEGFNPASLSVIIWDTIKEVSQDDDQGGFGVHFSTPDEVKMYGNSTVTFWDDNGLQQLPRKIFLQILQFVAETTLENYTMAYDLEHSPELQSGVFRLELALRNLVNEIDTLEDNEDVKQYRERIESEIESENKSNEQDTVSNTTIIKQIRERRGSCSWITADIQEDETIVNYLPETTDSPSNLTPTTPTNSPNKPRPLRKTSSGQSSESESLSPIKEESLDDVFLPNSTPKAPKMTSLKECGKSVSIGWLSENDENDYVPTKEQRRRSSVRGIEGTSVGWLNEMDENDHVLSRGHRRMSSGRGIEGVVERLPELRERYEKALSLDSQDEEQGSRAKFQRVRTKIRALSIFKAPTIPPVVEQNDSEDRNSRRPSLNTMSTSLHSSVDSISSASSEK